jgi:hypothetical protein
VIRRHGGFNLHYCSATITTKLQCSISCTTGNAPH